jgi:entericidin B
MSNAIKEICLIITILIITVSSLSCNTIKGFGEDVEKGGQKIEKAAEKHK